MIGKFNNYARELLGEEIRSRINRVTKGLTEKRIYLNPDD